MATRGAVSWLAPGVGELCEGSRAWALWSGCDPQLLVWPQPDTGISLDSAVRGCVHTSPPPPPMKLIDASNARVLQAKCVPGTVLGAGDPTTGLLFSQPPHMWVRPAISGWYML